MRYTRLAIIAAIVSLLAPALVICGRGVSGWQQRSVVKAVSDAGGTAIYDFERAYMYAELTAETPKSRVPSWLLNTLGKDVFHTVVVVSFDDRTSTERLNAALAMVGPVRHLDEMDLRFAQVADSTLAQLSGAVSVDALCINGEGISDSGIAHLARLDGLKSLELICPTHLSELSVALLGELQQLRTFRVQGRHAFGAETLRELKSMRPTLRIFIGEEEVE